MPEILGEATPIFEAPVACLMPISCPLFWQVELSRSLFWKINGKGLSTIPQICLCSLTILNESVPQTSKSKNSNIWVATSTPWSVYPHNITALDGNPNFIANSRLFKFMRIPATSRVAIAWGLAQKISAIDSDFLCKSSIKLESILPTNLLKNVL